MGKKRLFHAAALVCFLLCGAAQAQTISRPKRIRIENLEPRQAVQSLTPIASRFKLADGQDPLAQTTVTASLREGEIVFFFSCDEPTDKKPVCEVERQDGPVWTDDAVEIDVDSANAKNFFYQIIVNSGGVVYDARCSPMDYVDPAWKSGARVETGAAQKSWTVTVTVPLESLGIDYKTTHIVGMNFVRYRRAGASEVSAHAPVFAHTWSAIGKLPDSAAFAEFVLPGVDPSMPAEFYGRPEWPPMRVYSTDGGFDEANLTRGPSRPYTAIMWPFLQRRKIELRGALDFGLDYSPDGFYEVMKANHILPLETLDKPQPNDYNDLKYRAEELRRHKAKCAFTPNVAHKAIDLGIIAPGFPRVFLPDKRLSNAYLEQLEAALKYYQDLVAVFFMGDEYYQGIYDAGIWLWKNKAQSYPFINEVNNEVTEKFGFGKYGIPSGSGPEEAYRRIAYMRWVINWCDQFERAVNARVRKISPSVLLMSDNHLHGVPCHDIGRWRYTMDVASGQIHVKPNPEESASGWLAKFYADVSGCPQVWNCVHTENYGASFTPQEVRAILSEYFRAGGTGLLWFTADVRGSGRMATEEYYSASDRWQYVSSILDLWSQGYSAKKPPARVGVFFSNPSQIAAYDSHFKAAYGLLARRLGAGFKYFDDGNLRRGEVDPSAFAAILVPFAPHERFETGEKLLAAASKGTALVICDPGAFSFDLDGSDLILLRQKLVPGFALEKLPKEGTLKLRKMDVEVEAGKRFKFPQPVGGEVIGVYEDGSAAAVRAPVGKGSVTWFGTNPLAAPDDPGWQKWWRALLKEQKVETDLDYWRLTLPAPKPPADKPGLCLTGNAIAWRSGRPDLHQNVELSGSYSYSVLPDATSDNGEADKPILFSRGRLTDRLECLKGVPSKDSFVSWNNREEVAIIFDLGRKAVVAEAVIYAGDYLSAVKLFTGDSPEEMPPAGSLESAGKTEGVAARRVRLVSQKPARYLRLVFEKRPVLEKLTIAEIELWAP